MKVKISAKSGLTVASAPRITLDISVEEFTLLEACRYRSVVGDNALRAEVDRAFTGAIMDLPEPWKTRVSNAAHGLRRFGVDAEEVSSAVRRRRS